MTPNRACRWDLAPSKWGALASFDSAKPRTTKRIYGSVGNSFVAAVEFGPTVRAKAIMTGGESGDPSSPHFTDQALMYTEGRFRDVLFTRARRFGACAAALPSGRAFLLTYRALGRLASHRRRSHEPR